MKIRERLIKCGDFSVEKEHMTIDTLYALKCYLILKKAEMNILGGRILFYFLAGGTDPETMHKLKELEKKNKDKICLVSEYETYPAGLGVFMQGDLMYEVMDTGLNIKDAEEMTPLEAVKMLEKHLHFTLEAEEIEDIDKILEGTGEKNRNRKKKKKEEKEKTAPAMKEGGDSKEPEKEIPPKEKETAEEPIEKQEKATVPERFRRRHRQAPEEEPEGDSYLPGKEITDEEKGDAENESSYFENDEDRIEYMKYHMSDTESGYSEDEEEAEYMKAISEDEEYLRQNGILEEDENNGSEESFILDVGNE